MNKIASLNYDLNDFVASKQISSVADVILGLSKEAQSAEIPDSYELRDMEPDNFALIVTARGSDELRKYAHYSKESAEISIAFLEKMSGSIPDAMLKVASTNLHCASKEYGLSFPESLKPHVSGDEYVAPYVNVASVSPFRFFEKTAKRADQISFADSNNRYPINTPAEIEKAASYFHQWSNDFHPFSAYEFSANTVKAADSFGYKIPGGEKLYKFASLTSDRYNEDFALHIAARGDSKKVYKKQYESLLKEAEELKPFEVVEKLAELDIKTGLDLHWGGKVEHPLSAVLAPEMKKIASVSGVTQEQLRSIPVGELTAIVGTEVAGELRGEEGPIIYDTLPTPLKKELSPYLNV